MECANRERLALVNAAARYDAARRAWVLASYADVVAALHEPKLAGGGGYPSAHTVHVVVRDAARRALSPEQIARWRAGLESSAQAAIESLPWSEPVDLVRELAEPWSLSIALSVAGASAHDDVPRLTRLAREVFLAAANATSSDAPSHALAAASELARTLARSDSANEASADVQAFVALSQTLPIALGAAWLELLRRPDDVARLRAESELVPRAVEELLRLAGPSRAVFRRAQQDFEIGGVCIAEGEHVILMLSAANRDPVKFRNPERFDLDRDSSGHVAFGRGAHACAGASVIRAAMSIATRALLDTTTGVELSGDVAWIDGFAIRGPATLPVVLRR